MILDKFFMVLPVYRLENRKYYDQMQEFIDKELNTKNAYQEKLAAEQPELQAAHESHLRNWYGGAWEFNEIIGFIKLYFYGTQIRGEYWAVKAKKIVKSRKKQFEYKTHKLFMELEIWDQSNSGIRVTVEEYILGCKKERKNRHIDTREFEKLSPHINWRTLYNENRQFS